MGEIIPLGKEERCIIKEGTSYLTGSGSTSALSGAKVFDYNNLPKYHENRKERYKFIFLDTKGGQKFLNEEISKLEEEVSRKEIEISNIERLKTLTTRQQKKEEKEIYKMIVERTPNL